jgi:hypothetical protein
MMRPLKVRLGPRAARRTSGLTLRRGNERIRERINRRHLRGKGSDRASLPSQANGQATISHVGIAVMVRIPWNETSRPDRFQFEIQDLDGISFLKVEGDLNVGRPAETVPGSAQHAFMAITGELAVPRAGGSRFPTRRRPVGQRPGASTMR